MQRFVRAGVVCCMVLSVGVMMGFRPASRPASRPSTRPAPSNIRPVSTTPNPKGNTRKAATTSRPSVPYLYATAKRALRYIVIHESKRDATCWTTVRMMEHFYARRPLSEAASFLKIEASKVLLYRVWRYASSLSPKKVLSEQDINAALPSSLQTYLRILEQKRRPQNPTAAKLKHYHRITENWRILLTLSVESMIGRGLFSRGFVDIKPLRLSGMKRLARVSTVLNLLLLQFANQTALEQQHHVIRFSDIRGAYQKALKALRNKGLEKTQGKFRVQHPIRDRALGHKLALQLTRQNMRQKIRALRSWNKSVYKTKATRDQMLVLLNRISPIRVERAALDLMFEIFRVGLGTVAIGNTDKLGSLMVSPLRRQDFYAPENLKRIPKVPYITLQWVTHRLEKFFAHHTHVNGDVQLRLGMKTRKGPRFFNMRLLGPDLDAVRDVTLHWSILQYVWKSTPMAKPIDPFAAEVLAERVSEFIWFYLHLAKQLFPKAKTLSAKTLKQLTEMSMQMRLMQNTPPHYKWGAKLRAKKKKLMQQYKAPMFAKLSPTAGIRTKPCNAWKAHLYQGRYALLQKPSISYVPRESFSLVDRRPSARRLINSSAQDTVYPGLLLWNGASVSTVDYDNDGRIDLFFTGEGCNRLYRNLGNYKFKDVSKSVGIVDNHYESHQALFADINNDGRLDLFVLHSMKPSRLFVQQPNGTFVDQTKESGIQTTIGANTATFFDYDNDGHLDLYIGYFGPQKYYERQLPSIDGRNGRPNVLYKNLGNGRFQNVTAQSGLGSTGWAMALFAFDANQDGHMDLFIGNDFGYDELYLNQGNGRFVERAKAWGVNDRTNAMNASPTDFNHDGRWDFYVSVIDMFSKDIGFVLPRSKDLVKIDEHILRSVFYLSGNRFYVSDKRYKDLYRSREPESFEPGRRGWSWSGVFFDLENDGDEDFYIVNGWAPQSYAHNQPNQLFLRDGSKFFLFPRRSAVTYAGNSRSAVAADLSGTGRMDLILNDFQTGPKIFRHIFPHTNNWLKVKLRGVRTNRFGVGARIRLKVKGLPVQMRQITAGINYLSQSSFVATFGLGKAKQAESLTVIWPNGTKQVVAGPFSAGKTIIVREAVQ